ncbi:hypothetical protein AAFC00_006709 [Neodothiora populina]|uniref:alpha-1,2-Mannosidase n=1 Tax=Neodothiora populina TaxID=2781224 RepID=A0ABR3PBA5_9PEZI
MFRMRRYRAFIAFAVISILIFYHFSGYGSWTTASAIGAGSLRQSGSGNSPTTNEQSTQQGQAGPGQEAGKDKEKEKELAYPPEYTPPPFDPKHQVVSTTSAAVLHPAPTPAAAATPAGHLKAGKIELDDAVLSDIIATKNVATKTNKPAVTSDPPTVPEVPFGYEAEGDAMFESTEHATSTIHWSRQPEHFPVSSTIQLPTGTPKAIPRIQHTFKAETEEQRIHRKSKLAAVKEVAARSWKGYRDNAFMHDEVKPVTGGFKDPFCGWAATLVDGLDTLWIMGLKEEFEEAVRAVGKIDFTTSPRKDIPLFETTIRYLGGLLSAYDLSDFKYSTLLDKAVELAEVLMGAFDTPNRMPVTYYHWMPTFASQPHRAATHVVMAELGSLSMEFTRLAQLTKEPKYYDAIDRISDAFYVWQNDAVNGTLIPGLFSTYVDASGCDKPAQLPMKNTRPNLHNGAMDPDTLDSDKVASHPVKIDKKPLSDADEESAGQNQPGKAGKISGWDDPIEEGALDTKAGKKQVLGKTGDRSASDSAVDQPVGKVGKISGWTDEDHELSSTKKTVEDDETTLDSKAAKQELYDEIHNNTAAPKHTQQKRQLGGELADVAETPKAVKTAPKAVQDFQEQTKPFAPKLSGEQVCIPQGLVSSNRRGSDTFTLGGMADSTYEYLPKEYVLLGGLEPKYRTMYEKSMDAAIEYLLYRPMTPDNLDILISGEFLAYRDPDTDGDKGSLKPEHAHLTCFAGAMFAMGGKIFNRKEDVEIGAKLTEGCVWAYNVTATGIMPESGQLWPCKDKTDCEWSETKYWEELDPHGFVRTGKKTYSPVAAASSAVAPKPGTPEYQAQSDTSPLRPAKPAKQIPDDSVLTKRQGGASPGQTYPRIYQDSKNAKEDLDEIPSTPTKASNYPDGTVREPVDVVSKEPLTTEEFAKQRIEDERLPPGYTRVNNRKYILRPEAIESVFYMHRITGSPTGVK